MSASRDEEKLSIQASSFFAREIAEAKSLYGEVYVSQRRLSVQSYCFRGTSENSAVAGLVKACGLSAVEMSGSHVNFKKPELFSEFISAYSSLGIAIVSAGVNPISGVERDDELPFEFLKAAGASLMSVDFPTDDLQNRLRIAEKLTEKYDIRLGIHNHGGRHWLGNSQALRWLFSQCSNRIGLCLDTAWALDAGENPVEMIEEFGSRLYLLHLKDFVFDRMRRPEDVVVGAGNLQLPKIEDALKKVGFEGELVLEYEGDVANLLPATTACVQAIRREMDISS